MNLEAYKDDRLRSNKGGNFFTFIDDIQKLWEAADREGKITRRDTKEDAGEFPIILYHIVGREPHPAFREIKPRHRQTTESNNNQNNFMITIGQKQLVEVCFTIQAHSDDTADQLMLDFQSFLMMYREYFMGNGVSEMLFNRQGEDSSSETHGKSISERRIYYHLTFDLNYKEYIDQIEKLAIKAGVQDKLRTY